MKKIVVFLLLSGLAYFAGAQEAKTFAVPEPAGEAAVSQIRHDMVNRKPAVIFTVNVPAAGSYQLQIFGNFTTNAKLFLTQAIPGSGEWRTARQLPIARNGWQVLPGIQSVQLQAGKTDLVFYGTASDYPQVDRISLTRTGSDAAFTRHTGSFMNKLDQIRATATPLSAVNKATDETAKVLANPEATYEHAVDEAFTYTTFRYYFLTAGTIVTFETKNSTKDPVLHLFHAGNPDAYSWTNDDYVSSESKLTVAIPVSANYALLVRPYFDASSTGLTDVYKDNVLEIDNAVIGGRRFTNSLANTGDRNFFTARLSAGSDTRLFTLTASNGLVRGYNDDYSGTGDWAWSYSSRVKKNFTELIKTTFVCAYNTSSSGTADIYMGNVNSNAYTDWAFPNYKADDCIQSAPSSGTYNCISWSGGITSYWEWPLDPGSSYYVANDGLKSFDNFYKNSPKRYGGAWNYTRTGATAANAAVDLWKIAGGNFTHGSVTKPGNNNPHGYDWESKPGGLERSFHPRNALEGPGYGAVAYYYRHDGTYAPYTIVGQIPFKTMPTDADAVKAGTDVYDEAKLGEAAARKLETLVGKTDSKLASTFTELYNNWKASWTKYAALSDPAAYTQNEAFNQLRAFCLRQGDRILPVVFNTVIQERGNVMNATLVWPLTEKRYAALMDEVRRDNRANPNDAQGRYIIRSLYGNYVRYIEKILAGFTLPDVTTVAPDALTVTVSPNPVRNRFTVSFLLNREASVSISAASAQTGRKLQLVNEKTLTAGTHQFNGDISRIAGSTGDILSVQVTVNGQPTVVKVMVGQ